MGNNNEVYVGGWLTRPNNAITEVMAKSGYFDWLAIDIEHNPISINQVEDMIRIIQLSNVEAFVRLSENNPTLIKRVLDAGADGIIVPMVNSADDVKKAKDACFYPSRGKRGVGLSRAQNYNPSGLQKYIKDKEPKTKIIIQIEHIDAVKQINEIFSVKGVFGYFIGPYDLSASLGKPGDFKCKEVIEALKIVKQAGIKYQIRAGYHVIEPDPQEVLNKKKEGYKIIAVSTDMLFFLRGLELAFKNN
ncbi:2,4-dihydroxyhept-2-ene-1,7-dioic acid aldolase [Patescibacteria group bacterium]|nr:2,4-dihydroxyhept-2-ene-1,7-dioic acid aldolase [Patescibacteria group bacterium]